MSYLMHNNKKYEISEETAKELAKIFGNGNTTLSEIEAGKTAKIGEYEFVVLEQLEGKTAVILKDLLHNNEEFGEDNNYENSHIDDLCNAFAEQIADIVGEENLCDFEVDLTAANGMKCYGKITRKAAALTLAQVQKYAPVLCEYNTDEWYWLATANGTEKWGNKNWIFCVSPFGFIDYYYYYDYYDCYGGVRPFCILNSNIFVS